jgi:hypothetical protein
MQLPRMPRESRGLLVPIMYLQTWQVNWTLHQQHIAMRILLMLGNLQVRTNTKENYFCNQKHFHQPIF